MASKLQLRDKTVWVTGGSNGLGLEISKICAAEGAHVTILARRQHVLDEAVGIIKESRISKTQDIKAISANLSDAEEVETVFRAQSHRPDFLFCCAGGTPSQVGFVKDISPSQITSCMNNNYLTAAFCSQILLKIWSEEEEVHKLPNPVTRRIIFINSVAAFCTVPGMCAYSAPKCAVRGLADCLRMEALVYSSPSYTYKIQCAFPSTFISESFYQEQQNKPLLTKQMEGTDGSFEEMKKIHPSSKKMADIILKGVAKGDFAICDESVESPLLFANCVGVTPKRGWGIVDTAMGLLMHFAWPLGGRPYWDGLCKKFSATYHGSSA